MGVVEFSNGDVETLEWGLQPLWTKGAGTANAGVGASAPADERNGDVESG